MQQMVGLPDITPGIHQLKATQELLTQHRERDQVHFSDGQEPTQSFTTKRGKSFTMTDIRMEHQRQFTLVLLKTVVTLFTTGTVQRGHCTIVALDTYLEQDAHQVPL